MVTETSRQKSKSFKIDSLRIFRGPSCLVTFPNTTWYSEASFLTRQTKALLTTHVKRAWTRKTRPNHRLVTSLLLFHSSPTDNLAHFRPPRLTILPLHRPHPPLSLIRRHSNPQDGKVANPSSAPRLILSPESEMSEAGSGIHVPGAPAICENAKAARCMYAQTAYTPVHPANARIARKTTCAPIA